ncbi:MAG: hypothetical protein JM58_05095 [Peptococcaceae bacterium BICA1-8]|nr:MAG: hypothetical protein JM58_05095 [Peptococcaceae bacterium BICA1-8]
MCFIKNVRGVAMKVIDLSHTIHTAMPFFPGTEPPIFEQANTLEKDGFIENKLTIYSHTGTHVDVPAHEVAILKVNDLNLIRNIYLVYHKEKIFTRIIKNCIKNISPPCIS